MSCFDTLDSLPEFADAVFVLNQEAEFGILKKIFDRHCIRRAVIVTSHAPFPDEQKALQQTLDPVLLHWIPMSWLLTDRMMEDCDNIAVDELTTANRRLNTSSFLKRSRFLRNQLACIRIRERLRWRHCFASNGLGVVLSAWKGALALSPATAYYRNTIGSMMPRLMKQIQGIRKKDSIEVVSNEEEAFAFIGGPVNRLRFRAGTQTHKIEASTFHFKTTYNQKLVVSLFRIASRKFSFLPINIATTVHNFSPWMLDSFPGIMVFVDGFHPPNYPVSYGAAYRGARIVSREDSDRLWFKKCGCTVIQAPSIIEPDAPYRYAYAQKRKGMQNVCLMLNHAGDWSALIDRSDTDLAVMTFAEGASRLPSLKFRIRPHPTMANPAHEGIRSLQRLKHWAQKVRCSNLSFSQETLANDLAWADCCVSEYSAILVDCFNSGKNCIALNPTNRRSFLDHLRPIGLPIAHNSEDLVFSLKAIASKSETLLPIF